ncbi:alpha-1B-glycoprotein-like [Pelodiscus sinensis]|uniref:alpha-1B-glycoprotein-like n=1 Tax=Pelodiscus sinensis TaxID=13735 RepID=UPI003F6C1E29
MQLPQLLPLLASLQMLLRPVSPAAPPPAPELTVSPQYSIFLPGESLTLTCSAPSTATGIFFFRDGQRIDCRELQRSQDNVTSLQLSSVSHAQAGAYSCGYWKTESGRNISSERSQNIHIAVTGPLPAPQLTVSPQEPVYLTGETVTLTCSTTSTPAVSRIQFVRDNQQIHSQKYSSPQSSDTHSIRLSGEPGSQAGLYSCAFWKIESGREIPSKRSQRLRIIVTGPLPAPQLTVSPSQPVYVAGEAVNLTCSAVGAPTVSGIRFYRDSQEILYKVLPSSRTSHTESLPLSNVSAVNAGEYSCESWETVSGREIKSTRSRTSSINVTGHGFRWVRELAVGSSFFLINGLIFLLSHCYF